MKTKEQIQQQIDTLEAYLRESDASYNEAIELKASDFIQQYWLVESAKTGKAIAELKDVLID